MRVTLCLAFALFTAAVSLPAHADPSNLPSPGDRTVGLGLTATGIALMGAGGYFIYRNGQNDSTPNDGKLALAFSVGGAITTAAGLVLWLGKDDSKATKRSGRSSLVLGPASASYRLEL
jgi:hypothetical protein